MSSPKSNVPPWTGDVTIAVGEVLPAVMGRLVVAVLPEESLTVRTAVYRPRTVYVCAGLGSDEWTLPSPKFQSKVIASLGSGVFEPVLEKVTVSGSAPSLLSAVATATGGRVPLTYSHRYRPASALVL